MTSTYFFNSENLVIASNPVVQALLVKRMTTNPRLEDQQWEGCKGLADLAARDSDGLGAVRRHGGTQV